MPGTKWRFATALKILRKLLPIILRCRCGKIGGIFRKGVVFCHTFFCAVRIFFYFCTNYKVDGHLIVFTCIGETPTSVGLPENGVIQKKRGEASPVGGCSYSFHKEMGHFCKRLLLCTNLRQPRRFFLLVNSKTCTDKCGLLSFLHKLTIVK